MTVAIFPFQVDRTDDLQGVYGRQIPQYIGRCLRDAGVLVTPVQWSVYQDDTWSHVTLESPLPSNVLREEMTAHHADTAILGQTYVSADRASLSLAVVAANGNSFEINEVFQETTTMYVFVDLVHRAIAALHHKLTLEKRPVLDADQDFGTWSNALIDADKLQLERVQS